MRKIAIHQLFHDVGTAIGPDPKMQFKADQEGDRLLTHYPHRLQQACHSAMDGDCMLRALAK